ncbi:hypothetical protein, partial [Vescimonas sp.]
PYLSEKAQHLMDFFDELSAAADVLCGCAFCIPATAQTDGFDRCPRFLRRHEVRYMEAYFVMG